MNKHEALKAIYNIAQSKSKAATKVEPVPYQEKDPKEKCKHCSLGYEPHFVDGVWSHGLPGGRYVCTRRQAAERMKVFRVLISWPDAGRMPNIEMTLLDSNQAEVGATVRGILEADGYDPGEAKMTVDEIEGPFETGFVLSRHGG